MVCSHRKQMTFFTQRDYIQSQGKGKYRDKFALTCGGLRKWHKANDANMPYLCYSHHSCKLKKFNFNRKMCARFRALQGVMCWGPGGAEGHTHWESASSGGDSWAIALPSEGINTCIHIGFCSYLELFFGGRELRVHLSVAASHGLAYCSVFMNCNADGSWSVLYFMDVQSGKRSFWWVLISGSGCLGWIHASNKNKQSRDQTCASNGSQFLSKHKWTAFIFISSWPLKAWCFWIGPIYPSTYIDREY